MRSPAMSWQKATAALVGLLVLAGVAALYGRTGRFSYANYERITNGMELSQVESLLGGPGEEIPPGHVPTVPPYAKLAGSPEGWLGVVWGERYFRWESSYS